MSGSRLGTKQVRGYLLLGASTPESAVHRRRLSVSKAEKMDKPTEKQILNRAYELWQEAGMPDGDEFWLLAQKELSQGTTQDEKSETFLE